MVLDSVLILVAILLTLVIILQAKGTGLGSSFGGSGTYHTKRGAEKFLFRATIALGIIFVSLSFINSLAK